MEEMIYGKTDLHLHLDGSLPLPVIRQLLQEEQEPLTDQEILSQISVGKDCHSLQEYLQCFSLPTRLLQSAHALTISSLSLIRQLNAEGLTYTEIRFAPQLHTQRGLSQEDAVNAVLEGAALAQKEGCAVSVGILLCMLVTGDMQANAETAELAAAFVQDRRRRGGGRKPLSAAKSGQTGKEAEGFPGAVLTHGVVGLDLAGAEGAVPIERFAPLFQAAYRADVPLTIHAGECGSVENIEKAVSYGARRIGHGCAAHLSESCMQLLRHERIVLEMCPTSNLQTKAVASPEEHPIRQFFDYGIPVTVNTDNRTVSNTNLEKEYRLLKEHLHFTDAELQQMNDTALQAAFLS